jgi:peptidoglycan/xylan/chitin deacetylase (PgdA/CDA1 family)
MQTLGKKVAVLMYHYVRPIKDSKFSRIKGLELNEFQNHLDILESKSLLLTPEEFVNLDSLVSNDRKPFSLLTFDDGLIDHYKFVLPELKKRGHKALFFPSSLPWQEKRIATVHRIHFLLEAFEEPQQLLNLIEVYLQSLGHENLVNGLEVPKQIAYYDKPTEKRIKFLLQRALPRDVREELVAEFFKRYVSADEADFLSNIYMTEENLLELVDSGMEIGSHGRAHEWFEDMTHQEQLSDLESGIHYLSELLPDYRPKSFSYPYGSYNKTTLDLIEQVNFTYAYTVKKDFFDSLKDSFLEIPRFDANDIYGVF